MSGLGVLLVEDDTAISEPLARGLAREGYGVTLAVDGRSGLAAGLDPQVALVILDVGLPFLDGLEVCRRLRAARPKLQILLLTARSEEVHAVDGLDAGADDYVAKPFRLAELLARVRAAARRAESRGVEAAGVRVDAGSRRAFQGETELTLSPKEFDLLSRLLADAGHVVTREQLLRDVWDSAWAGSSRTLDQHISWLRAKIGHDLITTVRGTGFRFRGADE
ncbi:MAG: two component transcriptional regulator, winged helix family [Frankiales bacterium]|nr:two component transcriptional regulator, winged helix family [Frankiales bacterium]